MYILYIYIYIISLIADGPHHYHPACEVNYDLPISPRFTPYDFLSRCKFSNLSTRQPMVEFYILTFPRFPLRKKEHKSYFGKNRTHDIRTSSRCAGYLLEDHIVHHLKQSIHQSDKVANPTRDQLNVGNRELCLARRVRRVRSLVSDCPFPY